jgi:FkbM family methyltransferase
MSSQPLSASLSLPGIGIQVAQAGFRGSGIPLLRALARLRPGFREKLLFDSGFWCVPLQKALQRSLGSPRLVQIRFLAGPLNGYAFECLTSEKYFLLGAAFEEEFQNRIAAIVKPGDVLYDIGAHAGLMALYFSALTGPGGRVYAFEPSPVNFQRLRRNLALNATAAVHAFPVGVSAAERIGHLRENGTMSALVPEDSAGVSAATPVSMIRLDDFVARDKHPAPALIKIDVEGHAGGCLAGMRSLLRDVRPHLACELHHPKEQREVLAALDSRAYRFQLLGRAGKYPRRLLALRRESEDGSR